MRARRLAEALRAQGRVIGAGAGSASERARTRAAWERWISEEVENPRWERERALDTIGWDETHGVRGSTAKWMRRVLGQGAERALHSACKEAREEAQAVLDAARATIEGLAQSAVAQEYDYAVLERGEHRARWLAREDGDGEDPGRRGRTLTLGGLERLGACSEQALNALSKEPPWLRGWALEDAAARCASRHLEREAQAWIRTGVAREAAHAGVAGPDRRQSMRRLIAGWPGRHQAPPVVAAMRAQQAGGGPLGDAGWAAAERMRRDGTDRVGTREDGRKRLEAHAEQALEALARRVRLGAQGLYTRQALAKLTQLWNADAVLARATKAPRLEEDKGEVGWSFDYDTAERLACGAWARAARPSEHLGGFHALRLEMVTRAKVGLLESPARVEERHRHEPQLAERVRAVRKIEGEVRDRWGR